VAQRRNVRGENLCGRENLSYFESFSRGCLSVREGMREDIEASRKGNARGDVRAWREPLFSLNCANSSPVLPLDNGEPHHA